MGRIAEEEKLDEFEIWREKFTESRVAYMTALDEAVREGDISLIEAVTQFSKNMQWPYQQARQYLLLMSTPQSRFKALGETA